MLATGNPQFAETALHKQSTYVKASVSKDWYKLAPKYREEAKRLAMTGAELKYDDAYLGNEFPGWNGALYNGPLNAGIDQSFDIGDRVGNRVLQTEIHLTLSLLPGVGQGPDRITFYIVYQPFTGSGGGDITYMENHFLGQHTNIGTGMAFTNVENSAQYIVLAKKTITLPAYGAFANDITSATFLDSLQWDVHLTGLALPAVFPSLSSARYSGRISLVATSSVTYANYRFIAASRVRYYDA
jgi:hypothetical protein